MTPESPEPSLPALLAYRPDGLVLPRSQVERSRVKPPDAFAPPQTVRQLETSGAVFARGLPPNSEARCRRVHPGTPIFSRYVNIVRQRVESLGLGALLGQGTQGQAYLATNRPNLVIKITADRSEAAAAYRILTQIQEGQAQWGDFPSLARIYAVYGVLDDCDQPLPVFVVLQEFVPRPPSELLAQFLDEQVGERVDAQGNTLAVNRGERIVDVAWHEPRPMSRGGDLPSDLRHAAGQYQVDLSRLFLLVLTIRKMAMHQVAWRDLHAGNLRMRINGEWKIVDLGYSVAPNAEIPTLY